MVYVLQGFAKTSHYIARYVFRVWSSCVQVSTTAQLEDNKNTMMMVKGFQGTDYVRMIQVLQNFHCLWWRWK